MSTVRYTIRETLLASTIRHTLRGYGGGGAAPPVDPPAELAFLALSPDDTTYEMLGVKTGTGDLTTTHTADLYAPDSDDVYRQFAANEAVYSGGRVVNNYILNSDDLTAASWLLQTLTVTSGITDPDGGSTAVTLTATSGNAAFYTGNGLGEADQPAIMSLWIRRRTGTGTIEIETPGVRRLDLTSIITGSWQRVTTTTQETQSNTRFALWITSSGDEVDIWQPALQSKALGVGVGSSLLGTPEFDSDSDWTKGTGWSIAAGVAHCDGTQTSNSDLKQIMTGIDEAFQFVTVTVEFSNISAGSVTFFPVGLDSHTITENGVYSYIEARGSSPTNYEVFIRADADFVGDVEYCRAGLTEVLNGDIPEEYVATGASAVTKVFGNQNGNTVASNVVTEATGTPLASAPYLQYYPAATNLCTYSNDLTNAAWLNTGAPIRSYDQTGLTGESNTATYIEDNEAGVGSSLKNGHAITSTNPVTAVYYIKKDSDTSRFPECQLNLIGISANIGIHVNTQTGAITRRFQQGTDLYTEEMVDAGDWWRLLISYSDLTGVTSVEPRISPADGTVFGTNSAAATGSIIVGNVELYEATAAQVRGLGPIFTTSASVSTDATDYDFDIANHDQDDGAYYLEHVLPDDSSAVLVENTQLWGVRIDANRGYYHTKTAGKLTTHTAVSSCQLTGQSWAVGDNNKHGCVYHATEALMGMNFNGNWDTDNSYSGTWAIGGTNSICLASKGSSKALYALKLRDFRRYSITSFQQGEDTIDGLMADPPAELAFLALSPDDTTYEMLGVKTGTGDLTTTHTADLYAPDPDNVYRQFAANEAVYSGGRTVTNWITDSNDYPSNTASSTSGVTLTATNLDFFNASSYTYRRSGYGSTIQPGATVNYSAILSTPDGKTGISMRVVAGGGVGTVFALIPLTSTPTRYTISVPSSVSGNLEWGFDNRTAQGGDLSIGSVDVADMQLEIVLPGGSSYVNPSERVSTTGAAKSVSYASLNGNTVASNVVTEATGTPLAEAPYLQYYPAATNLCQYSNDLTQTSVWTNNVGLTTTQNQVGLTGEPNTATLLNDTDANYNVSVQARAVSATVVSSIKWWVKKDTDQTRFPCLRIAFTNGPITGSSPREYWQINSQTGATTIASTGSGISVTGEMIDDGDWWLLILEAPNATSQPTLEAAVYASSGTVWGTLSAAATGTIINGQVEIHDNKTIARVRGLGPIFTTSASVSTDAIDIDLDPTDWVENTGMVTYQEYKGSYAHGSVDAGLWRSNLVNGFVMGLTVDDAAVNVRYKNTSDANINFDLSGIDTADVMYQTGGVSGADVNQLALCIDGVYSTVKTDYKSNYAATSLRIPRTAQPYAFQMRNLRMYFATTYAAGKTTLDGLMINYLTGDSFNDYLTDGLGNRLTV